VIVPAAIYLAYLNGFAPRWSTALDRGVQDVFPLPIHRLAVQLDLEAAYARDRQQYHATLVLAGLLRHLPTPGAKILGITPVDLYAPVLTFVFGQSQLAGSGAVVSMYRLRQEFYGLQADESLLIDRAIKEAVHELGHAFGLVHCSDYECVMHASTGVEEVDLKRGRFCRACRAELDERGWA
jgi:archaemetzincin